MGFRTDRLCSPGRRRTLGIMELPEWVAAVVALGGDRSIAEAALAELGDRYGQAHRRYHDGAHVRAVVRDCRALAEAVGLPAAERAVLVVAAGAHDVVYDAEPGADERRSADWAREWLTRAGVPAISADRVAALVLATLTHTADDPTAQVLLDADLAILAADPDDYARYRAAVRAEYAAFDDAAWRAGRTAVLGGLLDRPRLYATEPAHARWETAARANLDREFATLAWPRAEEFLRSSGTEEMTHPGGTLYAHLLRVARTLRGWGADPDVQLAGLCHAAYGTDGFAPRLLDIGERSRLRGLIGERAESIVYLYGSCARDAVYPRLGRESPVLFVDRFTGAECVPEPAALRAFAEITVANELDVLAHNAELKARHGRALSGLFDRSRALLSAAAWAACVAQLG